MLIIIKILYRLRHPPKTFFDNIWAGLLEWRLIQSKLDPCLFMKSNMICFVYVANMILSVTKKQAIEDEIKIFGVRYDEDRH